MLKSLLHKFSEHRSERQLRELERTLPDVLARRREELAARISERRPRILIVKQDVNEDLYCCPPDSPPQELVASTLLRTGPVSLLTDLNADFRIVTTVDDPECQVWQERATALQWDTLEFFSSYRERIPGREYGQNRWSQPPEQINWSEYDIVISMDVCVPARITANFPNVLWCYYVREIKAPSYTASFDRAARGQDVVLNHHYRLRPPDQSGHVLEFPYHLQRPGCFHQLFERTEPSFEERSGVFVDHHTMIELSAEERQGLTEFGCVASTLHAGDREIIPTSERLARRTMDEDLRSRLLNSRYFLITPGQRMVFGTAMIEAIAAGCLVIGSPESLGRHAFFFTHRTAASDAAEAMNRMRSFDADSESAIAERRRQQQLVEYLCFVRPMHDLLDAWLRKVKTS